MGLLEAAMTPLEKFESFVGVNVWTMLFAWANLLILYLFLKKLLFKPLKNMIDSRQKEIDDAYDSADEKNREAENLRLTYEKRLSDATRESEEIVRTATRRAELESEEILKEAGREADRIIERAEERIELERRAALEEIKNEVSTIALEVAAAVIERDVTPEEHEAFIDEFISEKK